MKAHRSARLAALLFVTVAGSPAAHAQLPELPASGASSFDPERIRDVVLNAQYEYLDAYLVDADGNYVRKEFIDPDPVLAPDGATIVPARIGRHVNGQMCFFPDKAGPAFKGHFVIADDTYREACVETGLRQARCDAPPTDPEYVGKDADGWGVFANDGTWSGRVIQTNEFSCDESLGVCIQGLGTIDPQGCAFDSAGNLFGTDVGGGAIGVAEGALIVFFNNNAGRGKKSGIGIGTNYAEYCHVLTNLGAPGMPATIDENGRKAILFTEATTNTGPLAPVGQALVENGAPEDLAALGAGPGRVHKLTFPTGELKASDCDSVTHELKPSGLAKLHHEESFMSFPADGVVTPESMTLAPANALATTTHFYVGSVLIPPVVNEYDVNGQLIRNIVPPLPQNNPIGMDVGSDGTLYYADLALGPSFSHDDAGNVDGANPFDTGCGTVRRVRFAGATAGFPGVPLPPETIGSNLAFTDGVTVIAPRKLRVHWASLPDATQPAAEGQCAQEQP